MDVFLSYASADREVALRLAKDLEAEGVGVWTDVANLKPGDNWVQALLDAIRNTPNFVALVSKNTATSPHFTTELAAAIAATEASTSRRIVPVLTDKEAILPPFLRQFQALDATTPERYRAGVRQLSRLVKQEPGGPLPRSDLIKEYETIIPGLAERLLTMAENEQLRQLQLKRQERQDFLRGRFLGVLGLSAIVATSIVVYAVEGSGILFFASLGTAVISVFASFAAGYFAGQHARAQARSLNESEAVRDD